MTERQLTNLQVVVTVDGRSALVRRQDTSNEPRMWAVEIGMPAGAPSFHFVQQDGKATFWADSETAAYDLAERLCRTAAEVDAAVAPLWQRWEDQVLQERKRLHP